MNRMKLAVALLAGAGLSLSVVARDSERYIGGGVAFSYLGQRQEAQSRLVTSGSTGFIDVDKRNYGGKFFIGYRYNEYIGIELGYRDHGTSQVDFYTAPNDATPDTSKISVKGYDLALVGNVPVMRRLNLFAKVGTYFWQWQITSPTNAETKKRATGCCDPIFGLGVRFDLTDNLSFRLEAERATSILKSDPEMYTLGVEFRF